VAMSNLALNCLANDNILILTQGNQTLYDVCQQQRSGVLQYLFSYTGNYFIISLFLNSNTQIGVSIGLIINGQQPTIGPVVTTPATPPTPATIPATTASNSSINI
jgi:hypothetical protein